MKIEIICSLLLPTFFSTCVYEASGEEISVPETDRNRGGTNLPSEQKGNTIKNTSTILTIMIIFALSFQPAHGQEEEMSIAAKNILEQIAIVQKEIDKGTSYTASTPEGQWIQRASSSEERARFYERFEPNDTERKKFDEALNGLAKSNNKKVGGAKEEIPIAIKFQLDEIARIRKQVENFDPAKNSYLVNQAEGEWLLRAISMKERGKWANDFFKTVTIAKKEFWKELDELAEAGATKISTYKPNTKNFAFKNAQSEELMKQQIGELSKIKIHKIGLADQNWQIVKNDIDIPISRYKQGYIWARNLSDDHTFCHLYQVNIIQEYAGGGTYGESYSKLLGDWLFGCP